MDYSPEHSGHTHTRSAVRDLVEVNTVIIIPLSMIQMRLTKHDGYVCRG